MFMFLAQLGIIVAGIATCSPDFGPPESYPGGVPFAVADFNSDGKPDIAFVVNNSVKTLLGIGDGSFQQPLVSSVGDWPAVDSLDVGDFNADGLPDLVTQLADSNEYWSRSPRLLLGVGDGT